MLFQLLFTSLLNPKLLNLSRSVLKNSELQFIPSLLKEKQFNDTVKGLTIFVDKKNLYSRKAIESSNFKFFKSLSYFVLIPPGKSTSGEFHMKALAYKKAPLITPGFGIRGGAFLYARRRRKKFTV